MTTVINKWIKGLEEWKKDVWEKCCNDTTVNLNGWKEVHKEDVWIKLEKCVGWNGRRAKQTNGSVFGKGLRPTVDGVDDENV